MSRSQQDFIEFLVDCEVLTFGDFTTKSGRKTPYFVNTGKVRTGSQIAQFASFYAQAIVEKIGDQFEVIFGPAYKGIPLATAIAACLARDHGIDRGFCFDRKETKDHGEGGSLVGAIPADGNRVLIVEDVTTAGTSIRETVPKLRAAADITLAGLMISVDRCERGTGDQSALDQLSSEMDMPCISIVTVHDILGYLHGREIDGKVYIDDNIRRRMEEYLKMHGPRDHTR
ncbi:MAG: orotate phosphoribosyltransferase [Planctomycetota bacterium]|nr:orotate phosphoribosyltransferase [Planctomycetota bacterium]